MRAAQDSAQRRTWDYRIGLLMRPSFAAEYELVEDYPTQFDRQPVPICSDLPHHHNIAKLLPVVELIAQHVLRSTLPYCGDGDEDCCRRSQKDASSYNPRRII